MGMIDINKLPREIRDMIELREATDQTFYRFMEYDYTDTFFDLLNRRREHGEHSILLSVFGTQGSGKSTCAMTIAAYMDPRFTVERIFFNYNDLVYARSKLQDHTAVVIDEQSQVYGLDAHRVMTILQNLKEQLRKKSIHFIFCAPVLYPEHETSMYLLEAMFIDEEVRECVCALYTRDRLCLGHVRIPHPLNPIDETGGLVTKEFMDEYQRKKDAHLERVLDRKSKDVFEERAEAVMSNPVFKKMERIYVKKYGYVPMSSLQQLINKLYPDFGAGVMAGEIAGRIKLDKELKGEWELPGASSRKARGR